MIKNMPKLLNTTWLCRYFVVANAIASGYLVLSLPFSIVCIVRPHAAGARLALLIFDTVISEKPFELTYLQLFGSTADRSCLYYSNASADAVGFYHCCSSFRGCHCLFGSQRQSKRKLACNLSAVHWFLSARKRGCGGLIHCSSHLRIPGCAFCCGLS